MLRAALVLMFAMACTEASSPMPTDAPPTPITIYVKPYVRKYVEARLSDPEKVYFDDGARQLWNAIQKQLHGRQLQGVGSTFSKDHDRPSDRLVLMVVPLEGHPAEISYFRHRYLTGMLTKAYLDDMVGTTQWYSRVLHLAARRGLELFRTRYGITEEDHSLDTADRIYRYRKRPRRPPARQRRHGRKPAPK